MEAISVAASIAGLVGIAGQAISGVIKLDGFIQDVKELDGRTESLTKEARSLAITLNHVKSLLESLGGAPAQSDTSPWNAKVAELSLHLKDCHNDLVEWTSPADARPRHSSKRQRIIDAIRNRRLREISGIESKIERHRSQLSVDLGALTRYTAVGNEGSNCD
ncbi:hypothetical protein CCHR01_09750 [Colletotrichum chrysophilum]|uniref:Fungal N-terminal domain-containing protein n=1 Tax=Colletotrichum chrysophilum TaxID=1836956 RepID=A0AAD9AG53_9PEZI|nr:hypothetical protein CCHR01_09750 [Colletotrichum chrysophilum]